jgi:hypothetical protein
MAAASDAGPITSKQLRIFFLQPLTRMSRSRITSNDQNFRAQAQQKLRVFLGILPDYFGAAIAVGVRALSPDR